MQRLLAFFLLYSHWVFASNSFDCVIAGTSPFSLFEALYQYHSGNRVLILEEAPVIGGAWRTIDMCGVTRVDLGCHQIGHDSQLRSFLEDYVGCQMVSLDQPFTPYEPTTPSSNGYYFSKGCSELMDHLIQLIQATEIVLLLDHKMESIAVDPAQKMATVKTKKEWFTTSKVILTPMSDVSIENQSIPQKNHKTKYYHLYLLIQDPSPPRFSYQAGFTGASRLMNLTHFANLASTGRQLVVVQTHNESSLSNGQMFLQYLKDQKLLEESAYILREEPYIYEAGYFNQAQLQQLSAEARSLFEILNTGHFQSLSAYLPKWKTALKPYSQAISK